MDFATFRSSTVIHRPLPNGVTYDLSNQSHTTITLPSGSTWTSGLHWHEDHTEYLHLIKGSIKVRLDSRTLTISAPKPGEPEAVVKVDRYVRHEWSRADRGREDPDGDDAVVVESTDPEDAAKHVFFWNVNGIILEAQARAAELRQRRLKPMSEIYLELWVTMRLFAVFAVLDNFPSLINLDAWPWSVMPVNIQQTFEWMVSHAVLGVAALMTRLLTIQAIDERYTPHGLLKQWTAQASESEKER